MRSRPQSIILLTITLVLLTAAPLLAQRVPVIERGREAEIVALVAPFETKSEVAAGFMLDTIAVSQTSIRLSLVGPGTAGAALRLSHLSAAEGLAPGDADADGAVLDALSASFALFVEEAPTAARPAVAALVDAVTKNDPGGFWRVEAFDVPAGTEVPLKLTASPFERFLISLQAWLSDGILLALLALLFLGWLLHEHLREEPRAYALALLATVAVAALLRLIVSEPTTLTAWPYTRVVPLAARIYEGPVLGALLSLFDGRVFLVEVISTVNFAIASLTPLVLFLLAKLVFKDARAGLIAAALIAILPMHLRFSRSDVYSIQSIVVSSLALVALLEALLGRVRPLRYAAFCLLPLLAYDAYVARPPNLLFFPLFLAVTFLVVGARASRSRRIAVALLVAAPAGLALLSFLAPYGDQVRSGLHTDTLRGLLRAIVSLDYNTLINPRMTSPLMAPLAVGGAVALWLRPRLRGWGVYLVIWLGLIFGIHAYVTPFHPYMQARYHLHLLVPFVLLATAGLVALWRFQRALGAVAALLLALSPVLHLHFVRDVALDMQNEFQFLRLARAHVPEGCLVLEYGGEIIEGDVSHVLRPGAYRDAGEPKNLWTSVLAGGYKDVHEGTVSAAAAVRQHLDRIFAAPPDCVFLYEGLRCWGEKYHDQDWAEACKTFRAELDLEPVAEMIFSPRVYDANFAKGFGPDLRNPPFDVIELRLHRVLGRRAIPARTDLTPASVGRRR